MLKVVHVHVCVRVIMMKGSCCRLHVYNVYYRDERVMLHGYT